MSTVAVRCFTCPASRRPSGRQPHAKAQAVQVEREADALAADCASSSHQRVGDSVESLRILSDARGAEQLEASVVWYGLSTHNDAIEWRTACFNVSMFDVI